jgi:hypothetical protein
MIRRRAGERSKCPSNLRLLSCRPVSQHQQPRFVCATQAVAYLLYSTAVLTVAICRACDVSVFARTVQPHVSGGLFAVSSW